MAEKMTCAQCGMPCEAGEFHPYAACLMFTACHDSDTVRANLAQPAQAVDVEREIACALAEADGFDPDDQHGGLYDLRWSGGPAPEPMGDAWTMDYLPKAEQIAKRITRAIGNAREDGE